LSENRTELQEWVRRRTAAVHEKYSAFDALIEHGVDAIPDEHTPTQVACPFHGADNKPSARYYPTDGRKPDYLRCFKCKENWRSIDLYAKYKGLRWMEALSDLERRFRLKIPRKPEVEEYVEPAERRSDYASDAWGDVQRVLNVLEGKLVRLRNRAPLADYVRFCRVIDAVQWDLSHAAGKQNPDMVKALIRLREMMDAVPEAELPDLEE
jgi:hypothetical protein